MRPKNIVSVAFWGFLGATCVMNPSLVMAQAPAGPLAPPQSESQSDSPAQPAPPVVKPKQPEIQPRANLAGTWKLNLDDSDDPKHKVRTAEDSSGGDGSPTTGYPRRYPGGGYPGGGYPGGGYPYPGGGGSRPQYSGPDIAGNPKMQPLINPPGSLTVDLKSAAAGAAPNTAPYPRLT